MEIFADIPIEKWIEAVLDAPLLSIEYWWTDGYDKCASEMPSPSFARNSAIRQLLRAAREMEESK